MTSNAVKRECDAKTAVIQVTVLLTCRVGSDLLKLTRDDLVQICGPADGIRLFNALKSRCVSVFVFFVHSHEHCEGTGRVHVSDLFVQVSASQVDCIHLSGVLSGQSPARATQRQRKRRTQHFL